MAKPVLNIPAVSRSKCQCGKVISLSDQLNAGLRASGTGRPPLMTKLFQRGYGDWKQFRSRFSLSPSDEVDLHFGERDPNIPYYRVMAEVMSIVEGSLKLAQQRGRKYLMFIHGHSTSRRGKTTARSQVRTFMRSSAATPFIERSCCIQHGTVFVAKIRPLTAVDPN